METSYSHLWRLHSDVHRNFFPVVYGDAFPVVYGDTFPVVYGDAFPVACGDYTKSSMETQFLKSANYPFGHLWRLFSFVLGDFLQSSMETAFGQP